MIVAIVPSAGKGERFGSELPKQFLELKNVPILIRTLLKFENSSLVDRIIVVAPLSWLEHTENLLRKYGLKKVEKVVAGGKTRQESVWRGVQQAPEKTKIFLVHDAVRPFFPETLIEKLITTLLVQKEEIHGVIPGVPVRDTLNLVEKGLVKKNVPREGIYHVQTPQAIKGKILKLCLEKAQKANAVFSDESSLLLYHGFKVKMIEGSYLNLKITYKQDLLLAEKLIECKIENLLESL